MLRNGRVTEAIPRASVYVLLPLLILAAPGKEDYSAGVRRSEGIFLVERAATDGSQNGTTWLVKKVYKGSFIPGQILRLDAEAAAWSLLSGAAGRGIVCLEKPATESTIVRAPSAAKVEELSKPQLLSMRDINFGVHSAHDVTRLADAEAGIREALRRSSACDAALRIPDVVERNRALLSLVRRVPLAPVFLEDYSPNPSDDSMELPDALEGEILGLIQFSSQDFELLAAGWSLTPFQFDRIPDPRPQIQEIWQLLNTASQAAAPIQHRLAAIRWLGRCWWSPNEDLLKAEIPKLLEDPDPRVRAAAVVQLRGRYWVGFPGARDVLLQAASCEREPFVRLLLIQALARVEAFDAYVAELGVPFVIEAAFRDGKAYWICAAPGGLVPFAAGWTFRALARPISSTHVVPVRESQALNVPGVIPSRSISLLSFDPPLDPGPHDLWIEARAEPGTPGTLLSPFSSRPQRLEWGGAGFLPSVVHVAPGETPRVTSPK